MNYRHQAMVQKSCLAIAILGISTVLSGLTSAASAQSVTTHTSNMLYRGTVDLLKSGQDKFQRQDYRGAILDFNQAIFHNPNDANIYFNRGLVLHELGDELGALWDFDDTILRNPRHARAYFHRAGLRLSLGYRSGAMQDLQQAAKLFVRIQVLGWGKRDGRGFSPPILAIKASLKNLMAERPCWRQVCTTLSKSAV